MGVILSLPSWTALILVIWYLKFVIRSRNYSMLTMCIGFIGVLCSELVFFLGSLNVSSQITYNFFIFYYLTAVIACLSFLFMSLSISGLAKGRAAFIILVLAFVNFLVLLKQNAALLGITSIGYGFTRVAGPYYWIVQLTFVGSMIGGYLLLLFSAQKATSIEDKHRSFILLFSSTVFVLCVILIVLLMQLGFSINALVIAPLGIIVFMGMLIYSERKENKFKILSLLPNTHERVVSQSTINALLQYKSGNLQGAVSTFEKGVILSIVQECQGNKTLAAEKLGISRATLRRKLEEYGT